MIIEYNTKNGIAINHTMKQQLRASKQQLLETAAAHTFIGNSYSSRNTKQLLLY